MHIKSSYLINFYFPHLGTVWAQPYPCPEEARSILEAADPFSPRRLLAPLPHRRDAPREACFHRLRPHRRPVARQHLASGEMAAGTSLANPILSSLGHRPDPISAGAAVPPSLTCHFRPLPDPPTGERAKGVRQHECTTSTSTA